MLGASEREGETVQGAGARPEGPAERDRAAKATDKPAKTGASIPLRGGIPALRGAGGTAVPAKLHSGAGALRRLPCARADAQRSGAACSALRGAVRRAFERA